MQAGKLNKRIIIQSLTITQSASGGVIETWADFATRWASIEPLRGREYFEAKKENAEVETRIRLRYTSGVLPNMRVQFGTRYYLIVSVINPNEKGEETELMCREVM